MLGACGPASSDREAETVGEIAYSAGYGLDQSIHVVRADGTGSREVARGTDGGPAWSPDGTQLAFVRCDEFESSCVIWVHEGKAEREVWRIDYGDPVWSPDGTELAFVRCGDAGEGACAIFAVPTKLESRRPRRVTEDGLYGEPVWSPDGKRLAFEPGTIESPHHGIVVVAADGSGVLWSTEQPDTDPNWSPDGRRIAFVRSTPLPRRGVRHDVYVIAADGTAARRITDGKTGAQDPAWSPAGDWIAFTQWLEDEASECPSSAVFATTPDGSELRQVTRYGPLNAEPAWSPDGRHIAYVRMDECWSEEDPILSLIAAEGDDARPISLVTRLDSAPVARPPYVIAFAWRPSP